MGRRDSTTASVDLANSDLPGPDMSLGELISAFADKGLTAEEMAALSGARTIGQAPTDIDPLYEVSLSEKKYASSVSVHSAGDNVNILAPLDVSKPHFF